MGLLDFLRLPEVKPIKDLDLPETTLLHRALIQKKPFLKKLYLDFYSIFLKHIPDLERITCVELGSGGGFIKEVFPTVITSDILNLPGIDQYFSGLAMPFEDHSIDAFVMIDVFHHVPDSAGFLRELARCLKAEGKIVMIEPANTGWGRFIYQNFHHEPFAPQEGWGLSASGPLSSANGALPYIVFQRDRQEFQNKFPDLKLQTFEAHTPLRYLISGGVSMRQLLPSAAYPLVKILESLLTPFNSHIGMFYTIVLKAS